MCFFDFVTKILILFANCNFLLVLLFVCHKVFWVKNMQLESPCYQSQGIHALLVAVGEEFLYEVCLPFLEALYAERHAAKQGYLFLGVS